MVTDRHACAGRPLCRVVEAAIHGGVRTVQLREKDMPDDELLAIAHEMRSITRRRGVRLLINDRIDIALAARADGVHLPAASFSVSDTRKLLGNEVIVGVSTHSFAQAERAQEDGADYVIFGPIFDTPAKRRFGPPRGLDELRQLVDRLAIPIVAIGGIDSDNAAEVRAMGVSGIAAIRAISSPPDTKTAAAGLTRLQNAN